MGNTVTVVKGVDTTCLKLKESELIVLSFHTKSHYFRVILQREFALFLNINYSDPIDYGCLVRVVRFNYYHLNVYLSPSEIASSSKSSYLSCTVN